LYACVEPIRDLDAPEVLQSIPVIPDEIEVGQGWCR
jgi:hypothetical protein